MNSEIQFEGQTTKKFDLPLSHLEYSYIEKCTNVKELEKIVRVLRSGEEGKFPDLERFAERRLEQLCPKSRALRKDGPILKPGDLSGGDWKTIEEDLKSWTNSMHDKESGKPLKTGAVKDDLIEGDENLPPIRSTNIVLEGKKQKVPEGEKKKKRVMPRDYKEWDKVDVDAELKKLDNEEEKQQTTSRKSKVNGLPLDIDTTGMSEEEKELKANREKDKGNEAFRSHDFEESVVYYSRSISLMPTAASYNNRSLAYLKLEKWDKAIRDCNSVLNLEVDNIKALLRRGTAYKSKKDYKKGAVDFERVLKMEPNNKKAEDLLAEVNKELKKEEKERKEKGGRRMVIDEIEESDEEADEEIEVEKPVMNGYGPHDTERGDQNQPLADSQSSNIQVQGSTNLPKPSVPQKITEVPTSQKVLVAEEEKLAASQGSQPPLSSQDPVPPTKHSGQESTPTKVDTTQVCSASSSGLPASSKTTTTTPPGEISASPSASSLPEQSKSTLSPSTTEAAPRTGADLPPSSNVSFTLEGVPEPQAAAVPPVTSDLNSAPTLTRPVFVQLPLPSQVQTMKEEGNKLFRSGQYGDAILQYSKAISKLQNESEQHVNLSVLLSNRAACHLKTGNCSQAVSDCQLSLQHVPHTAKALLRRASAYETMEKYAEAYVDYKHVISVDKSADQAHQGATRCQSMLQTTFGVKAWREKIPPLVLVQPWEVPVIVDQAGMHKSLSSTVSLAEQDNATKSAGNIAASQSSNEESIKAAPKASTAAPSHRSESAAPKPPPSSSSPTQPPAQSTVKSATPTPPVPAQRSKEEEFEEIKAKGNQHVQKGQYQEALECYSKCVTLNPSQVAIYTNRALCYLKLNMASEAESDCDKALSLQPDNPKAFFRRALARKMCHHYKQSLQDLVELLKLEPKNSAAQKEMDIVKKSYKEELDMLKQKKAAAEQELKVRKRMKIEEVDDDEEEEKPTRVKAAEKSKSQGKSRGGKMSQGPPVSKSKNSHAEKKPSQAHEASIQGQPVAPPIAPRLMKTTPYEFCQAWNSLKPCQGTQPYAEILRQVSPTDLHTVISNKLDGQMLQIIVKCVNQEMVHKGEVDLGYQILDNLCKVPRFTTVAMFMSGKEKKEVSGVLDVLSKTSSTAYTAADIVRLKKEYSVK